MSTPTSLAKLDAVNEMLSCISEAPINTLTGSLTQEADLAIRLLDQTSFEVQAKGWHWNTERLYKLTRDSNQYMNVPINCIRVKPDPNGSDFQKIDFIQRGTKLYDKINQTLLWANNSSLTVEMLILLDWDDLPEAAKRYICTRAARKFQDRVLGSQPLHGFNEEDELMARGLLEDAEVDVGEYTMLDASDIKRTLRRR